MCYRPFFHSRHNAKDKTPKVGRDINHIMLDELRRRTVYSDPVKLNCVYKKA